MSKANPFTSSERRPNIEGPFQAEEVWLANRNGGMLLEALRHDVTPAGLHYLLSHFDVPYVAGRVRGRSRSPAGSASPLRASLDEIRSFPQRTLPVTLECAGNGRGTMRPRYPSMPWCYEAVGTAEWTGTPLRHVLERAGLARRRRRDRLHRRRPRLRSRPRARLRPQPEARAGAERRRAAGVGHERPAAAAAARLSAAPDRARLVRHGEREVARPHRGADRSPTTASSRCARISTAPNPMGPRTPITHMRVKSLLVPPAFPTGTRARAWWMPVPTTLIGRAWSGAGVAIAQVEVGIDGKWTQAELDPPLGASLPGAAGAAPGRRSRASTSLPAAPPTPTARRSRWRRAGMPAASATTPCTGCT